MSTSGWKAWLAASILLLAGAARAAPVTVQFDGTGPFAAGEALVVRLIDADPTLGLCAAGICAADLRLSFDTALVQAPALGDLFPGLVADPSEYLATLGAPTAAGGSMAYVDITFFAFPSNPVLAAPTEILSLSFTVQPGAGGLGAITVEPFEATPGLPPTYVFTAAASPDFSVTAANTVPEPASLALAAAALGIGGWTRRRRHGSQAA